MLVVFVWPIGSGHCFLATHLFLQFLLEKRRIPGMVGGTLIGVGELLVAEDCA